MCNLKSNKTLEEFTTYINEIKQLDNLEALTIFPSGLYLSLMSDYNISFGSQDISIYTDGSSTGEITAKQVKSTNAQYTIIGHSERRNKFSEDELLLLKKIKVALNENLKVVYCIGETKEEKLRQKTYQVLEKQIAKIFNSLSDAEMDQIIIAYEPIWAIGGGNPASAKDIAEISEFIKKIILDYYDKDIKVLYGGSVNSDIIASFNKIKTIDGYLVGSASLKIEEVAKMLQIINKNQ